MNFDRIIRGLFNRLGFNNVVVNNVLIWFGLDRKVSSILNWYPDYEPREGASLQEIAGFSDRPEINDMLAKLHGNLTRVRDQHIKPGDSVLDIGCGPGLYLKEFDDRYKVSGLDISPAMVRIASREIPHGSFHQGDFLKYDLKGEQFDLIYSVGVLIYFNRSDMPAFFRKVDALLKPGGVFFLSYPHAISRKDTMYPDLSYIQYSPRLIEKLAKKHFNIVEHHHGFDDRTVDRYDTQPHVSQIPGEKRTYLNSYLLVAQKPA